MSRPKTRSRTALLAATVVGATLAGCGGAEEETATIRQPERSAGREAPPPDDGLQVQGLMGSLSVDEIQGTLDPRLPRFARCFSRRYDELELVGGEMRFSFRVKVDGTVLWVFPSSSTVGDRQTERCLLDVAESASFPRPHGGEAEFSWSLAFDPPEDVRPPVFWDSSRVTEVVDQNARDISRCDAGSSQVTVYVAPGGTVMAAGASSQEQPSADALDCVTDAVAEWEMPDPGSYPAKVSFQLP